MRANCRSRVPSCSKIRLPAVLKRGSRGGRSTPFSWAKASRGCCKMYCCCKRAGHWTHRSTMPVSSFVERPSRRTNSRTSVWLPVGNRTSCRAELGVNNPTCTSARASGPSFSIKASRRQCESIFADQCMHDPGFFHLTRPASGAIQPVNRCLRAVFIGFHLPSQESIHRRQLPRGAQSFEPIDQFPVAFLSNHHNRRQLAIAFQ